MHAVLLPPARRTHPPQQPCLPVGLSDLPAQGGVKIFCPRCEDVFLPRSEAQGSVDGAYFGTTFPHLMLLTYPAHRPQRSTSKYVPRVFGFKLHPTAYGRGEHSGLAATPSRNTIGGGGNGPTAMLSPPGPGQAAGSGTAAAAAAANDMLSQDNTPMQHSKGAGGGEIGGKAGQQDSDDSM